VLGEQHGRAVAGLDAGDPRLEALDREDGGRAEPLGPVREVGRSVAAGAVDEVEGAQTGGTT
jgi:hypothetical protein